MRVGEGVVEGGGGHSCTCARVRAHTHTHTHTSTYTHTHSHTHTHTHARTQTRTHARTQVGQALALASPTLGVFPPLPPTSPTTHPAMGCLSAELQVGAVGAASPTGAEGFAETLWRGACSAWTAAYGSCHGTSHLAHQNLLAHSHLCSHTASLAHPSTPCPIHPLPRTHCHPLFLRRTSRPPQCSTPWPRRRGALRRRRPPRPASPPTACACAARTTRCARCVRACKCVRVCVRVRGLYILSWM